MHYSGKELHSKTKPARMGTNYMTEAKVKKPRAPKRDSKIIIKEQIDKLSNADLKEVAGFCEKVKQERRAKAEAEAKELS